MRQISSNKNKDNKSNEKIKNVKDVKAEIVETKPEGLWLKMFIPMTKDMDMMTKEERIQEGLNEGGLLAMEYALQQYDTDGSFITV